MALNSPPVAPRAILQYGVRPVPDGPWETASRTRSGLLVLVNELGKNMMTRLNITGFPFNQGDHFLC